jgi:hypothetical protein
MEVNMRLEMPLPSRSVAASTPVLAVVPPPVLPALSRGVIVMEDTAAAAVVDVAFKLGDKELPAVLAAAVSSTRSAT